MDIESVIRQRRTIHQFNGQPVRDDLIRTALDLALWAPNHKLTFPWKFYDLGPDAKANVIDLAARLKSKKGGAEFTPAMEKSLRDKLESASRLIFLGIKKSDSAFQMREDYATLACGVQNASLYLWSHGVGSKWSTAEFTSAPEAYDILQIDPREVELVGVLLIGHFSGPVRMPPRPPLETFLEKRS